ncbi:UNVERIFIED_CONTAM: site-specific recombinase XerD [Brevibacillus sp. OAP136]
MEKTQTVRSIEEQITSQSSIREALEAMTDYKCWSESTLAGYRNDVSHFEAFLYDLQHEPLLSNGKLHLIQKWIKQQREQGVSRTTIKRRTASLSSVFSFYRDVGVVDKNCFKAVEIPPGNQEHHSPILEMEQLKQVYRYADNLSKDVRHVSPTIKMLIFTGLRNEALTKLKVKHIRFDKELIWLNYDRLTINSKHKVQIIPLPPRLLQELKRHVQENDLQADDKLLFGLAGLPLADKAINRLTNRISEDLHWLGENRITPHGFRATISTILSERGVDLSAIKFLLGHSEQDNLHFYIRRFGRVTHLLRRELTRIEEDLYQTESQIHSLSEYQFSEKKVEETPKSLISRDTILKLLETKPEIAIALLEKGLARL